MLTALMMVPALWATAAIAGVNEDFLKVTNRGDLPAPNGFFAKGADIDAKMNKGATVLMANLTVEMGKGSFLYSEGTDPVPDPLITTEVHGQRVIIPRVVSLSYEFLGNSQRLMTSIRGEAGAFTLIEERGDHVEQYLCWFKGSMTLDDAKQRVTKLKGTIQSLEPEDEKTITIKKTELKDGTLVITTKGGAVYVISGLGGGSIPHLQLIKTGAK